MEGYLDQRLCQEALQKLSSHHAGTYTLTLSSKGGDYDSVMELCRALFEKQKQTSFNLRVQVDKQALGAAALVPFLADERYFSPFSVWGAMQQKDASWPEKNIVESQVMSLLQQAPDTLKQLFLGMLDPSYSVYIYRDRVRLEKKSLSRYDKQLSQQGESLVMNDKDLIALDLGSSWLQSEGKFTPQKPPKLLKNLQDKASYRWGHLLINDWNNGINSSTWVYVKSALKHYQKTLPDFILLELDTPGGEAYTSQKISDLLRDFQEKNHVPIIAFIHNRAYSAGAMLAYSCQYIASTSHSSMGAAEVVFQTSSGMESAPEKINSAFRADFINRAKHFQRNPHLAEAMVDKDVMVVKRHGQLIKLSYEKDLQLDGPYPDRVIVEKGKLLTLNAQDLIDYGVSDQQWENQAMAQAEQEVQQFLRSVPLLTSKNLELDTFELNWDLKLFALLVSPVVSSLIFLGLLAGAYYEFTSPGVGIPGFVAVICLALIGLSSVSLETFNLVDVFWIFGGVLLLGLELFITPGFGFLGLLGFLMLLGGLISLLLPGYNYSPIHFEDATLTLEGEELLKRMAYLFAVFFAFLAFLYLFGKKLALASPLAAFISRGEQEKSQGYLAKPSPVFPQVGARGESFTVLCPSGKVKVEGKVFDASSQGEYISAGQKVEVIRCEQTKVIVKAL